MGESESGNSDLCVHSAQEYSKIWAFSCNLGVGADVTVGISYYDSAIICNSDVSFVPFYFAIAWRFSRIAQYFKPFSFKKLSRYTATDFSYSGGIQPIAQYIRFCVTFKFCHNIMYVLNVEV